MESMRDINRVMEREVAKGSCPLAFERMEFGSKPFQFIISEEKLNEVLTYLLRIRIFRAVCREKHNQQCIYGFGYALQKAAV